MKSIALACALAAAALGTVSLAQAQGWERGGREQEGRRGGWSQERGGPQQGGRAWQRGQQPQQPPPQRQPQQPPPQRQPQQRQPQPQVQVQPAPQGQWGQQRQWNGQRRDAAGPQYAPQYPPQHAPQYGPPAAYPRYGIPSQGYVQPVPPQAHYGQPGRHDGAVQVPPAWQHPQWQNQEAHDGRGDRGAWRQAPRFRRGDYLPPEYRHHYVQDWRAHRLYAPPPGYQWVQVDTGDYLLIAIGTGVIANLLLGQ